MYQYPSGPPGVPPAAPKKRNTAAIWLGILAGVLVLLLIAAGIFIFAILNSDRNVDATGGTVMVPKTNPLKDRLGSKQSSSQGGTPTPSPSPAEPVGLDGKWCYAEMPEYFEGCFTITGTRIIDDASGYPSTLEYLGEFDDAPGCDQYVAMNDPQGAGGFMLYFCPAGVANPSLDPFSQFPELMGPREAVVNQARIFSGQDYPMVMSLRG